MQVRRTFSASRAWRPTVGAGLTRTLGVTSTPVHEPLRHSRNPRRHHRLRSRRGRLGRSSVAVPKREHGSCTSAHRRRVQCHRTCPGAPRPRSTAKVTGQARNEVRTRKNLAAVSTASRCLACSGSHWWLHPQLFQRPSVLGRHGNCGRGACGEWCRSGSGRQKFWRVSQPT